MAAKRQYLLRKQDGSGAGYLFKTEDEVDKFMKQNPGYAVESEEQAAARQAEDDAAVAEQEAQKRAKPQAADKAVGGPRRGDQ